MGVRVNSLWVGNCLRKLEQVCINSHLSVGHEYHLWTYGPVENIPEGVVVEDANSIIPESNVFTYRRGPGKGSYGGFSNLFRYGLLRDQGGWWVDVDLAALKPFEFDREIVIASEDTEPFKQPRWLPFERLPWLPTTCALKVPAASPFIEYCWERASRANPNRLRWGRTGPRLVAQAVARLGLDAFVVEPWEFCPTKPPDYRQLIDAPVSPTMKLGYGVHFWNEMWRRDGVDKDQLQPHPQSVYGRLIESVRSGVQRCAG